MRRGVARHLIVGGIVVICVAVGFYLTAVRIRGSSKVSGSQRRGDAVVIALNAYKRDLGRYPDKLDSLVPKYIGIIRPPTVGNKQWDYDAYNDGQSFELSITYGNYSVPRWHFSNYSTRWTYKSF
jgi:hypothetical protein